MEPLLEGLLRGLGLPQTSEKSLHELFQSGGWLEDCLSQGRKKTMTAIDVTGFDAIFSTGFFATFFRS